MKNERKSNAHGKRKRINVRKKLIVYYTLTSISLELSPTYCHIVQRIPKLRYCSLSGSRLIDAGTGKRSSYHLILDRRPPISLTNWNPSELNTPPVSLVRGTNSGVCDRAAYFCFLSLAEWSAAAPDRQDVDAICDTAHVSDIVTSHVRHLPLAHEINVTPSGHFSYDLWRRLVLYSRTVEISLPIYTWDKLGTSRILFYSIHMYS